MQPLEPQDTASAVGQIRWNAPRTERLVVLGCYGYGSGGRLYSVTFPNRATPSPTGISEADLDVRYPLIDEVAPAGFTVQF